MKRRWLLLLLLPGLLFLVDRPAPHPRHAAEWLVAQGLAYRTVRAGDGKPTVLLIHGFGESLVSYRTIFDPLSTSHAVVAIDLPGFGVSDKPEGPYDYASMLDRLRGFVETHLGDHPIVVVGHSMGGQLAAGLAIEHPAQIKAVILIAPTGYGLSPLHAAVTGPNADLVGWLNVPIGYLLPIHAPDWLSEPDQYRTYDPLADPRHRAAATEVLREFDFAALRVRFPELRQPTLLLWGREDPTVPLDAGHAILDLLPCARLVVFERTLHRPHLTEPVKVTKAIERFLVEPPSCPGGGAPAVTDSSM